MEGKERAITGVVIFAHPMAELTVLQKALPLGIALQRFGATLPTRLVAQFITSSGGAAGTLPTHPQQCVKNAFAIE